MDTVTLKVERGKVGVLTKQFLSGELEPWHTGAAKILTPVRPLSEKIGDTKQSLLL